MLARWRSTGADLPWGDPRVAHGVAMEGWFWRFTDPARRRVVIALCGVCRDARGEPWAATAIASQPGNVLEEEVIASAAASTRSFRVDAGEALRASEDSVSARAGACSLDVELDERTDWPAGVWGALGPAHLLPGLGQYWTPHVLGARVRGTATLGGEELSLDGWQAYAEKNWSRSFPTEWWWGQAQGFEDPEVCVAFAGGRLAGPAWAPTATALVVRVGGRTVRLSLPTGFVGAEASPGSWRLRGRSPRYRVEVEGTATDEALALPVPVPGERRTEPAAHEHLRSAVRVTVREGRRLLYRGESDVAGLEYGRT